MPAIGEMGGAVSSRVRFQELPASESDSVDSAGSESSGGGTEGFELREDPSFWKDHNVQVVIRIRPLSSTEISFQGHNNCVRQETCQTVTWTGHPESRFTFDLVADEHVSQEKLFKVAGVPMVENCVLGYNSCMFAYGQTGSGKTHTMLGDIEGGTRRHSVNCGMTPRVFEYMFSRIQKEKEARRDENIRFTCKCSFLEIYNEQILDLLDPSSANLQIREDAKKGVHVENLTEFEVSRASDVMQQLIQGAANRKVAATNMNRASSRSHSVFTCVIESKWEAQGVTHHRFARLNLVDLAGSERQKSSGAEGDRLKEATNINKSLSTLGLVIMNLVSSSNKKPMHVPYRDSKLTFLLQDSLGGNSKTIIIANISPSNCCALETLSTLKFAQRAKFIRNNAIVNEDASGDVLAMRLQIQQLKKEVNRLQGLVAGGTENFGCDSLSALHPGSPGNFKWDGVQGSFSPLTFDKRLSQKKEYEAAQVAAFRRDQDKDAALKALAAGKQSAEQLANQRTEEVRSLKMILRFREEGIKRLEAINSGKLSAETHLLQEREELLKEIEVVRNQVDRNPEVTRFAMENLQLKEELRRLQAFVEEGEREALNEQITILQDKLLEVLDWKLMHEKDTEVVQDRQSLIWDTSNNEENEFLRLQAIQNQREVEALRKNLTFCLEAKEKLERHVDELVSQLKEQRSSFDAPNMEIQNFQNGGPVSGEEDGSTDDQSELKTMVDAIAAASQREADAHETAIMLVKENEELHEKIKVLIEDNNKLIELYDGVVAGGASNQPDSGLHIGHNIEQANNSAADYTENGLENTNCENYYQETRDIEHLQHRLPEMHEENEKLLGLYEKTMQEKDEKQVHVDIEHLQHQLHEMHEENDKLLGLYEKAMQEKDELKKLLSSYDFHGTEAKEEINCDEKQVHMDDERDAEKQDEEKFEELLALYEKTVQERDEYKKSLFFYELNSAEAKEEMKHEEIFVHVDDNRVIQMHERGKLEEFSEEKLCLVRTRLDQVQDQLEAAGKAVKYFGLLEKATSEVDELRDTIEGLNQSVQLKQQELTALRSILPKTLERRTVLENKFLALKIALQNAYSKVHYWDKREEQAREMVKMCSGQLEQKKEELRHLKIRKDEADSTCMRAKLSESELRDNFASLKLKYQAAESQKKETERVLFAIDNNPDLSWQRATNFGKASEILKSEEERSKISAEIKQQRERLAAVMKEIAESKRISETLDTMIQSLEAGIESGMCSLQEAELRLMDVLAEMQVLSEMEVGMESKLSKILVEYQECIFVSDLKEEEIKLLDDALQLEVRNLEELTGKQLCATHKLNYFLEESRHNMMISNSYKCSRSVSEKIEIELGDVQRSLADAKSLSISVRYVKLEVMADEDSKANSSI